MKIYCIKIDGMPFCPEVLEITDITKGILLRQVSGCYTTTTLAQMFTGKLSSDLEPRGLGYTTWKNKADKNGFADWSWIEECIQFYLWKEKGFKFVVRNSEELSTVFGFSRYPQFYESLQGGDEASEYRYIDDIQKLDGKNVFHFISYNDFHDACQYSKNAKSLYVNQRKAGQNLLKRIKHWNFSEPDSLFWIFSDHGAWIYPRFGGYPFVQNFYTWAVMRDNLRNLTSLYPKVISAQDFTSIVCCKFEKNSLPRFSKDRIFLTEDGRMEVDADCLTTAIACHFENWTKDFPLQMSYIIYYKPENRFLQRVANFSEDQLVTQSEVECKIDEHLRDVLKQHFSWVSM